MFYSSQYQELYHFGVKGMKWGVRKQRYLAKKDAKETAKANMYYGDGAGVRRRHINSIVNRRSKDPTYKKAYEEYLAKQNMARIVAESKRERKREDFKNGVKEKVHRVSDTIMDHPVRTAKTVALVTAAALMAHRYGIDKTILKNAKMAFDNAKTFVQNRDLRRKVEQILNSKR